MKPAILTQGAGSVAALILMMALFVSPVMAGNTVTAFGEILSVPAPVAQFTGSPISGTVPLTVAFDSGASTGVIIGYAWDFNNDGTTDSTEAGPSFTYTAVGTYTVKLTVTGPGGSDDETKINYITVTAPTVHDIYWVANKPCEVVPGGTLQFRVTGAYSKIILKSTTYNLNVGDTVMLVTGSDKTGKIHMTSAVIDNFEFDNVRLYINGADKGSATVKSIWVSGYDTFSSTLAINVPAKSAWTQFDVDGSHVIYGTDSSRVQIFNLRPSEGLMNLDNTKKTTYYDGGADSYQVTAATSASTMSQLVEDVLVLFGLAG
jgi:PKD repeat protein